MASVDFVSEGFSGVTLHTHICVHTSACVCACGVLLCVCVPVHTCFSRLQKKKPRKFRQDPRHEGILGKQDVVSDQISKKANAYKGPSKRGMVFMICLFEFYDINNFHFR